MGWRHVTGNPDHPTATGRDSFRLDAILDGDDEDDHHSSGKSCSDDDE